MPDLDPQLVGSWAGDANVVAVSGHYAYVGGSEGGLWVLDLSEPAQPQEVGHGDTSSSVRSVAVVGSHAFVASSQGDQEGLVIFDVSNPAEPRLLAVYATPGRANDVFITNNCAYVADGEAGLQVIDISEPGSPHLLGGYDTSGYASGVVVLGYHAYVADRAAGLQIIDVSDPTDLKPVGHVIGFNVTHVVVSGHYAYVASWSGNLEVVDISDPTNPQSVGSYFNLGWADSLSVMGGYLYLAVSEDCSGLCLTEGGVEVVDISDPINPRLAGYLASPHPRAVTVAGEFAYVATYTGFQVVVAAPANPQRVRPQAMPHRQFELYTLAVTASASHAYLLQYGYYGSIPQGLLYTNRLQVVDIRDPADPQVLGTCALDNSFVDILFGPFNVNGDLALVDNYVYVADGEVGLQVINVGDPTNPRREGSYDTSGPASSVAVSGSYAYLTDQRLSSGQPGEGLVVFDISNPARPERVSSIEAGDYTRDVAVQGGYAYMAGSGLQIIDVGDPSAPVRVSGLEFPGDYVAVSGNHAYVRGSESGSGALLHVVDVSDPADPKLVGFHHTGQNWPHYGPTPIVLLDRHLYVEDNAWTPSELSVFDIFHPDQPVRVGGNRSLAGVFDFTVTADYVLVAGGYEGLVILHQYRPVQFDHILPNPDGGIALRISGPPGVPGRVQRAEAFGEWEDWHSIVFESEQLELNDSNSATVPLRFYRTVAP